MKKLFTIILLSSLSCCNNIFADSHKLKGALKFEGGGQYPFSSNAVKNEDATGNIYSEAGVNILLEREVENEGGNPLKYGGNLVLQTTTRNTGSASLNGSHIFIQSKIGVIELGSPHSASSKMQIRSVACGAGGGWIRYLDLPKNLIFLHSSKLPLDAFSSQIVGCDGTESTRKISYYTPKDNRLVVGISFIPDSKDSNGDLRQDTTGKEHILKLSDDRYVDYNPRIKNAFALATNYTHPLTEHTSIKIGGVLQFGTAEPLNIYSTKEIDKKYKLDDTVKIGNVLAYSIGGILTHKNFSFSASYGDFGDSLSSKEIDVKPSRYFWCLGGAYSMEKAKISITLFNSTYGDNKMWSVTLGSEYELADGLSSYFDIGYFSGNGYAIIKDKDDVLNNKYETKKESVSGIGGIIGIELKF